MLRKTALKRLNIGSADFQFITASESGALPAENDVRISLPLRAAVLLSVSRKLRWAGKPRPYICIRL
jgi:hypothetical protein